jgi:hypothetical protein
MHDPQPCVYCGKVVSCRTPGTGDVVRLLPCGHSACARLHPRGRDVPKTPVGRVLLRLSAADVDGWRALNYPISFWRFSHLPHTRICRRPSICARETCQRRWGYPAHHLRRKLASLLRQPRCQRRPGTYLSYFYIHIRKLFTNCRSPGWRFPLRQDSFFHVRRT